MADKETRPRVVRSYTPLGGTGYGGTDPSGAVPGLPPLVTPSDIYYEEGDVIDKVGYVDFLRLNKLGYSPPLEAGPKAFANRIVERKTYCLVKISNKVDASEGLAEFRIVYENLAGEVLATSMAVVAALKDAFTSRSKVCLHGVLQQDEYHLGFAVSTSDMYWVLKSVDLIRA